MAGAGKKQEGDVGRIVVSFLSLGIFIGWLVLSYFPGVLPTISYGQGLVDRWFGLLLMVGLVAFLAIQGWLTVASARMFRADGALQREELRAEFRLRRKREVLWTAIPLLMTIVLAMWSYPTWVSLLGY